MALFGRKKEDSGKAVKQETKVAVKAEEKTSSPSDLFNLLSNPRITEKATDLSDNNVYTFDVAVRATKPEIKKAIQAFYKVTPVSVRIVQIPRQRLMRRNGPGMRKAGKKAYVALAKGDKIDIF